MRALLHLPLLLALALSGCAPDPVPTNGQGVSDIPLSAESKRAFRIDRQADLVIGFNGATFSLDQQDHSKPPGEYRPAQLTRYFECQPRKNLIVVIFAMNRWSDARLKSEITRTNRYFLDRGYRRVVIQQHTGSSGRLMRSDTSAPAIPRG